MKIGYLTFGRDDFGYGLALCLSRLEGHEVYRITPKTAKYVDVLLLVGAYLSVGGFPEKGRNKEKRFEKTPNCGRRF
jgi:hypothetical protein